MRVEPRRFSAREIRALTGWSKARTAFVAKVSVATLTLFEADPMAVRDQAKRAKMLSIYRDMAIIVGAVDPTVSRLP